MMTTIQVIKALCPDCSKAMVKAGWQRTNKKGDRKQMYICQHCYRRTVNPTQGDN